VIGNTLLLLQSVHTDHNREAIMQQNDKVFRENQIEFEKEFKRRQAEIDKMQEVIDNNQKEIDKMQEVIDNRQKEIDDRQKELDRQRREDQRAK
jgi:peptidoglycan hydrolase CwlO-like protein